MSDQERLKYAYLLKNPKLDLHTLEVLSDDKRSSELVVSLLKQVKHIVRVRKFTITVALSDAPLIISKFDPRVLDDLEIRLKDEYIENLDTILELEQIKGLKYFYILTKLETHEFPLHCFLTYPVFSIVYDEATDLKPIVAFIRKLLKNSSNLKNCYFFFRNERFRQSYLRKSFSRLGMPVPFPGFRNYRHIPIPGSTDVYELEFSDRDICIERKKKEEVDYDSSSDSSDSDF
ncbi:hypothetical protein GCK72_008506 [Caenorhabditis remanei]|uniref:DUF38 domain-containing protein n=1 Tax=Caenorhabditis remanei TaxID=31234 RepID=A0A6A5GXR8_CAERE|nr:hypothetical protein GCK72_008506 [Caenorhabditis remanei]KAF1760260.1 hypothetical protein GCK72_008506 [Caenorhabditis remanei]